MVTGCCVESGRGACHEWGQCQGFFASARSKTQAWHGLFHCSVNYRVGCCRRFLFRNTLSHGVRIRSRIPSRNQPPTLTTRPPERTARLACMRTALKALFRSPLRLTMTARPSSRLDRRRNWIRLMKQVLSRRRRRHNLRLKRLMWFLEKRSWRQQPLKSVRASLQRAAL